MVQSSCHPNPFIAQDTMSRNGSRKQLPQSWSMGGWDQGTAEGSCAKILGHREPQARSMDSGTEGQILNQISMYMIRKLGPKKDDS